MDRYFNYLGIPTQAIVFYPNTTIFFQINNEVIAVGYKPKLEITEKPLLILRPYPELGDYGSNSMRTRSLLLGLNLLDRNIEAVARKRASL